MSDKSTEKPAEMARRTLGRRDGLFQRNGWWWVGFYDAEASGTGRRRRPVPPAWSWRTTDAECLLVRHMRSQRSSVVERLSTDPSQGIAAPPRAGRLECGKRPDSQ